MAEHLTLEQAFNADAASQRTGIALMTKYCFDALVACQCWTESHFLRTTIYLNEDLSIKKGRHYRKSEIFKHKQITWQ